MSSNFPNQIDDIEKFLDITSQDGEILREFKTYMEHNDFSGAKKVLSRMDNANQKIISAGRMNKLRDCILAVEKFYKDDISNYTSQKQTEWEGIINQFSYKQTYSSSKIYDVNNIVSFIDKGKDNLYIKTSDVHKSNIPPTDERYWRKLTMEGEVGESSTGSTTFRFEWQSSQNYPIDSIVSYNNKWWVCTRQHVNSEPREGSSYWKLIMESMQTIYPVQQNMPLSQVKGEIWFEVI